MPRPRNEDCYYEEVEHFGIAVQLKQLKPDGNLHVEHQHFEDRFRKSASTKDLEKAREWARELCKEIALKKEGGALAAAVRSNDLTLGELFDAFRERGLPKYKKSKSANYCNALSRCMDLLEAAWGRKTPIEHIDQQKIDRFTNLREEKGVTAQRNGKTQTYPPAKRSSTRADLTNFSAICSWAQRQRHDGQWLMAGVHPTDRVKFPARPKDADVSQPLADQKRYEATLEFADQIGKTKRKFGRQLLPTLLTLARHTGRRLQAIRNLRRKDICLDRAATERALRRGQFPVVKARAWPHGGIYWRAEHNKMDYKSVIPMNRPLWETLNAYLQETWPGLMERIAGEEWQRDLDPDEASIFPSPQYPHRPIFHTTVIEWLKEAEVMARDAGRNGAPPADEEQNGFHAYRRGWATERGHFRSDEAQRAVRVAGSWKPGGDTMREVYLQTPGSVLYRVVTPQTANQRAESVISLDTLDTLATRLVEQIETGTLKQELLELPELAEDDRKKLLWKHVRAVENGRDPMEKVGSEPADSQDVVKHEPISKGTDPENT